MAKENPYIKTALARKMYQKMLSGYQTDPAASSAFGPGASQKWAPASNDTRAPQVDEPSNPVLKLLDVISQPMYSNVQNTAEMIKAQEAGDIGDVVKGGLLAFSPVGSVIANSGSRNSKAATSDLFRDRAIETDHGTYTPPESIQGLESNETDSGLERFGKGAAGFAADVATDPMSYVSLGTAGLGAKALGTGINTATKTAQAGGKVEKAAAAATKAADATGNALIKADNVIGDVIAKGVAAPFKGAATLARKVTGKPKSTKGVLQHGEIPQASTPLGANAAEEFGDLAENAAKEPLGSAKMLRNKVTGEEVPFSGAEAAKREIPDYDLKDFLGPDGARVSPFTREAIPDAVPEQAAIPEQAVTPTPEVSVTPRERIDPKSYTEHDIRAWLRANPDAIAGPEKTQLMNVPYVREEFLEQGQPILGMKGDGMEEWVDDIPNQMATQGWPAQKRTPTPQKGYRDQWVKDNMDTEITVRPKGMAESTKSLRKWIEVLGRESTAKDHKQQINRALAREVTKSWRSADQAPWLAAVAPDAPPAGALPGPGAAPAPQAAPSAQEAAEAVREASAASKTLKDSQWREKSPEEMEAVKEQYREVLEKDHFEYLYGSYLDTLKTVDARAREFGKRVSAIAKGKTTTKDRYELFYQERTLPWTNAVSQNDTVAKEVEALTGIKEAPVTAVTGVKPASEIMQEAPSDMASVMERTAEDIRTASGVYLDETDRAILEQVLGNRRSRNGQMIGQQWNGRAEGFDYTTNNTRAAKNSPVLGQGEAVNPAFNAKAQANMMTLYIEDAAAKVAKIVNPETGKPIAGRVRARAMMDEILPRIKRAETALKSVGVEPVAGNGVRGIPVSMGDFFDALSVSDRGMSFLERRIFDGVGISKPNRKGQIGTVYMDGVLRSVGAIADVLSSPELIDHLASNPQNYQAITEAVVKMVKEGRTPTHESIHNALTDFGATPLSNKNGPIDLGPKGEPYYGPNSAQVVDEFMQVLFNKEQTEPLRRLMQTVQANSAKHGINIGDSVKELSAETMEEAYAMVTHLKTSGEVNEFLTGAKEMVEANAKNALEPPSKEAIEGATKAVEDGMADIAPIVDIENAQATKRITDKIYAPAKEIPLGKTIEYDPKIHNRTEINKAKSDIRKTAFKIHENNVADILREGGRPYTTDEIIGMSLDAGAFGRIGRKLNNAFVPSNQFPTLHAAHMRNGSLSNGLSQDVRRKLTDVARMAMPEDRKAVYELIQKGVKETPEHLAPLREAMEEVTNLMFHNTGETQGITSTFLENGFQVRDIINRMNAPHYGLPESAHFVPPRGFDYLPPAEQTQMFLKHLATTKVNDPVDYLARMEAVTNSMARDMSLSQDAYTVLKESGALSTTPKEGLVRVHSDDLEKNIVMRYMPHDGELFIDPAAASQLKSLNDIIQTPITPGKGPMKEFLRTYDPLLQMWKAGMTVYRVGHHVRNLVGDLSTAFLQDGVKNPAVYAKATSMLANRKAYEGMDMWKMMQHLDTMPTYSAKAKAKVKVGNVELSNEELYDELMKRGLFKTHLQNEDIARSTDLPNWVRNAQDSIQFRGKHKGAVQRTVGSISEYRDDFTRLGHAIDLIEKGKVDGRLKDLIKRKPGQKVGPGEFLDAVVEAVNRAHPDGSDLTTFERKYLRRVFPFYSWTRKAIPLVLEGMLMNPGRITVLPKAMYNFAMQNGVNPDSLSDPFPDDQLFPSYLADSMTGPLWEDENLNYYGISPGAADQDILNSFLGGGVNGAKNEILGMINPMLKVPVELAAGSTLGTQIPTPGNNPTEYLGGQIPMLSQAQSISGYDILGSVKNMSPTPLQGVEKGNRDTWGLDKVFNWFTGMQQQNMSTPSAIRRAELEQRESEG